MIINENTKIIARFHKKPSGRGLNIYNPFFEELGINALYVLFYNNNPKLLIDGLRSLNLFGAITAGFEVDDTLPTLLDSVGDESVNVGKGGYIKNESGKLIGHYQGGLGMYKTLLQISSIDKHRVAIVGAGNIASGLLYEINKNNHNCSIDIYNRDLDKASKLKNNFNFVENVYSLDELGKYSADILLNLTDIGGSVEDNLFTDKNTSLFDNVIDVTFEREETNLIGIAKKHNKKFATGWDMFANQGLVILEDLFGEKYDFDLFKKHVSKGLSSVIK